MPPKQELLLLQILICGHVSVKTVIEFLYKHTKLIHEKL